MQSGQENQGFVGSPAAGHPQYGSQLQQAPPVERNYSAPRALVPGILMIIASVINLTCFIVLVVYQLIIIEFIAGFVIYLLLGALAIFGAVTKQSSVGWAACALIMSIVALCMSASELIQRSLAVFLSNVATKSDHSLVQLIGQIVQYVSIVLLVIAAICFCLSIALIVIVSKVICCGPPRSSGGGVVYSQKQVAPN